MKFQEKSTTLPCVSVNSADIAAPDAGTLDLRFLSIRETAATGILPEHCLRSMQRAGTLPGFTVPGTKKFLVNYNRLLAQLAAT